MINVALSLFLCGLLFGSGPCLASCGPLLISYVAGTNKKPSQGLRLYILFSFSRILSYLIISLMIFFLGRLVLERLLKDYSPYIYIAGGLFIIFVGLLMGFGQSLRFKPNTHIFVFGLVIGFLPCAPLLAVFSYTGLIAKSWLESLFYALCFGMGTIVSILLPLTVLASFLSRLIIDKKTVYARIFNLICALVILILGVQLIMKGIQYA